MLGHIIAYFRLRGSFPMPESYQQKTRLTLPVTGKWLVANGGVTPEKSHSWDLIAQRYAYDLVKADAEGRTHRGEGKQLADYYAFGQPIVAPAGGEVVQVRNGIRDYPRPGLGRIDFFTRDIAGNYVVIRHTEGEYSFLAHLKRDSMRVKVGDWVERGQVIGLCGNSGHSTEPHLHFQVQDHPNFYLAVGLPVKFADVAGEQLPAQERYLCAGEQVYHDQSYHTDDSRTETGVL
jgi:murein DD-endopeptidase MepM/ murein hydrolase activator NlpD